jgi:hypothetical protein
LFYSKRINLRVGYSFNGGLAKPTHVGQHNRLLLQKIRLPQFYENQTNTLNVSVGGSGSGLVQFTVKYNTKREVKTQRNFDLKIQSVKKDDCKSVIVEVKTKLVA